MEKTIIRGILLFFSLIVCYLLFMVAGTLMPDGKVRKNIGRSVWAMERQGDYPRAVFDGEYGRMDNFTDALILNMAYHVSADSLKASIFLNQHAKTGAYVASGLRTMVEKQMGGDMPYPRYWHGSVFLMRFLLLFGNYEFIRQLLFVLSTSLLLIAFTLVQKQIGIPCALAYFSGFFFLHGFVMQMSIQFFPVLMITLGASIALSRCWRDFSKVILVFIATGSVTSFFDLLTTPLLTMGLPLVLYLMLSRDEDMSWLAAFWRVVRSGFAWGVSFAATWMTKWGLASLMTGENVFKDAIGQAAYRSGADADFSRWDAVTANLQMLNIPLIMWFVLAIGLCAIFFFNKKWWRNGSICVLLTALPYVWYFAISNHSFLHWWFTYRLQMLSVAAALVCAAGFVDWKRAAQWLRNRSHRIFEKQS